MEQGTATPPMASGMDVDVAEDVGTVPTQGGDPALPQTGTDTGEVDKTPQQVEGVGAAVPPRPTLIYVYDTWDSRLLCGPASMVVPTANSKNPEPNV